MLSEWSMRMRWLQSVYRGTALVYSAFRVSLRAVYRRACKLSTAYSVYSVYGRFTEELVNRVQRTLSRLLGVTVLCH
jgi:hypothetical protein